MATFPAELRISSASSQSMWAGPRSPASIVRYDSAEAEPIVEDSRTVATEAMKGGASVLDKICSLACNLAACAAPTSPLGIRWEPLGASTKSGDIATANDLMPGWGGQPSHRHCMSALAFRRRFERRTGMQWVKPAGAPDVVPTLHHDRRGNRRRQRRYAWPHHCAASTASQAGGSYGIFRRHGNTCICGGKRTSGKRRRRQRIGPCASSKRITQRAPLRRRDFRTRRKGRQPHFDASSRKRALRSARPSQD